MKAIGFALDFLGDLFVVDIGNTFRMLGSIELVFL